MGELAGTPGLRWRIRANGVMVAYWVAPSSAVRAGFRPKTLNLSGFSDGDISIWCRRMQGEAASFVARHSGIFDGTIASALAIYETHPESSFCRLKPSSKSVYGFYLARLARNYGARRIACVTGLDVMRWHATWREAPTGQLPRIAAASMALSVLKAALGFGQLCGFEDCARLRGMITNLRLPVPKPREEAPGVVEVRRAMDAARELGYPSAAFAYALQFEGCLRQSDVIGIWLPVDEKTPSEILWGGKKWHGPRWADISADLVLSWMPIKTADWTGRRVRIDLRLCPMIMEEIGRIPLPARTGPLVIDDRTGRPFLPRVFNKLWAKVRVDAGLPHTLWNRDLRAGGLTEGSMAGASSDDRAKLAAHSQKISARVYDRDVLISSSRVNAARAKFRKGGE